MSWFLRNLKETIDALLETPRPSVVRLFTNPRLLSSGDAIALVTSSLVVGAVLWIFRDGWRIIKVQLRAEYTTGKVYFHAPPSVKAIPCPTQFGMKLETYLRMAGIPYETIYGMSAGPKGKRPWIEYNGEAMGDSGLIIEFLNKEKGVDLNKNLSDTDRAVSRAFTKMIEENTNWGLVRYRAVDNFDQFMEVVELPWFSRYFLKPFIRMGARITYENQLWAHGIGRHSREEIEAIVEKDLKSLSTFLGSKAYLMGNEPAEVDAAVFGQLSELLWTTVTGSYLHRVITEDCPNLQAYCIRMKERYWPDWDQLTRNTQCPTNKNVSVALTADLSQT